MVRRAGPAQDADGQLPALTDCSSFLPGAGGGVRGEHVQRRRPGGERSDERPLAYVRLISDASVFSLQVPGETPGEAAPAGKKTIETVKAVRPD